LGYPPQHALDFQKKYPNIPKNISDEYAADREQTRRENVSNKVRKAYKEDRNTANKDREHARRTRMEYVANTYPDLCMNLTRSCSMVAKEILKREPNIGVSKKTLSEYISNLRKVAEAK
jgi:hypothetical protein